VGHAAHDEVRDEVVERVRERVLDGMGLLVLHSAHYSKIFKRLMGTSCSLKWREAAETERLWAVEPSHPIADGIGEYIELEETEMYGERFDIPAPDTLVFNSWFAAGGGVPVRLLLPSRQRPGVLLPPRPRDVPDLPRRRRAAGAPERGRVGDAGDGPTPDFGNADPIEDIDIDDDRTVH